MTLCIGPPCHAASSVVDSVGKRTGLGRRGFIFIKWHRNRSHCSLGAGGGFEVETPQSIRIIEEDGKSILRESLMFYYWLGSIVCI